MSSITSRQHPIVRSFRELARTSDPTGARVLLDGVHLVRDAAAAGLELEAVAIAASRSPSSEEAELARALQARGARVLTVNDQAFAAMSPVRTPSGVIAIARRRPIGADDICGAAGQLVLVAVDIQDPGNLGALVRAAEAGGAAGVVACGASANPFSWKAIRGSMGSVLRMPVAGGVAVDDVLRRAREQERRILAAVPRDGADPDALNWRGRVALVVGGEGAGLSEETVAQADELVSIPMEAPVESLNVAVAGAILVYAARRQRT